MADDEVVIGGDQLVDGMRLSVRLRRDFTVADADRLLAAARRTYQNLNSCSAEKADEAVSCAADTLFVLLEHVGLLGDAVDARFADLVGDGLQIGGWRAQVVPNEPWPLAAGPRADCLRDGDLFALPPD